MATIDRVLLERWVSTRDADSFAELAQRYSGMVYATCRRILGDATAAEDVAQECFEVLARWHAGPADYLGPWLHRVATTRSLNCLKAEARRREREGRMALDAPEAQPAWDDFYDLVDEAIESLPEQLRQPLILHFFQNETHERIALRLDTSRQTISYRIAKGVEHIRRTLKRRGVAVAAPALAGLFATHFAQASAPTSLCAALAKLAIAGPATAGMTGWAGGAVVTGGVLAMKKALVVCGVVLLVASGVFVTRQSLDTQDAVIASPASADDVAARATLAPTLSEAPADTLSDTPSAAPREASVDPAPRPSDASPQELQPRAAGRPRPVGTNTVSGQVVYAGSGKPVAVFSAGYSISRAPSLPLVRREAASSMTAFENAEGRFTLEDVSLERGATIIVQAPGFADGIALVDPVGKGASAEVCVELTHGANITGLVVDASHRPIAGADIYTDMLYVERNAAPPGLTQTAEDGRFMLERVPVEGFMVVAHKTGYAPGYVNVALREDETVDAEIVLAAGGNVFGRITKDGKPARGHQVRAHASLTESAAIFSTRTEEDGTYRISGLPLGETRLWAFDEMPAGSVHPTVMGKTVVLEPGAEMAADFDFTADARLSGTIYLHDEPSEARVHVSVDTPDGSWQEFRGSADANGAYTFDSLPAGQISLKAIPAARMSDSGYTAWQEEFTIASGEALEYDVHIRDGITLTGHIPGVAPGESCAVEVLEGSVDITSLNEPALALIRTLGVAHAESSPEGAFRVENLQPGAFTVIGIAYNRAARNNLERLAGARFTTVELDLTRDVSVDLSLEIAPSESP